MDKSLHQQINPRTTIQEIWNRKPQTIIDVRTSKEFKDGCLPGAVNIPLLSDAERSSIGILYKKYGRTVAVEEGYNVFEPKLECFRQSFDPLPKDRPITVYCARGGMRSKVITSFMRSLGYQAMQLDGGYKSFRKWNLERLDSFSVNSPIVLHGKTGVGKTLIINRLKNSLDLEECAQHRGSLFGAVGKRPVSQKTFEADVLQSLEALNNSQPVFIEGESRKVGNVSVPNKLFRQMKSARVILLQASIKTRVARIVEEYILQHPSYHPQIRLMIGELKKDLGKSNTSRLVAQFDNGEYNDCFEYILLNYYDRKYTHTMKNLTPEATINTENINDAVARIELSEQ